MSARFVAYGAVFGFLLSRIGASDPAAIHGMFALTDLHLIGVIGVAVVLNTLLFFAARRAGARARGGAPLALTAKPMTRGLVAGALVFGVGWALAGACPGTALVQVGEGRLEALVILAGMLGGVWLRDLGARRAAAAALADAPPSAS